MSLSAITLHARRDPGFDDRKAHALAVLRQAAERHRGRIVFTTSLGAEDMVLTDLIASHGLPITLATLQTGQLHRETLALLDRVEQHYGVAIERWAPDAAEVRRFEAEHGELPMRRSVGLRQACCALRKLAPLARALAGRSAWVTGLRRGQSGARADVPFSSTDEHGREKLSPLADWSQADVWHYIAAHGVPYNELHDRHYPSIGCSPCTRPVTPGEDVRAGRWWWESGSAKECGLHRRPHACDAPAADGPRSGPSTFASAQVHVGSADVNRSQSAAAMDTSKETA